jgi:hypothetical protein
MFSEWKILVVMHFSSDAAAEPFPHRSPSASLRLGIRDGMSWFGLLLFRNEFKE